MAMLYLLDTDHITFIQENAGPEYAILAFRLSEHPRNDVVFSVISFHEQLLGAHTYIVRAKDPVGFVRGYDFLLKIQQAYSLHPVVAYDREASLQFEALKALKLKIGTKDLQIAAIALSKGMTLITRNVRDFREIPGLTIEDWTV